MPKPIKYIFLIVFTVTALITLQGCTFDPDFDKTPGAVNRQELTTIPYNTWVDQLKQTDQKRYQEYVLLRKHIDSNHAVAMYRMHNLQDTVMRIQYANNQQIVSLRKEVHRLTNAVYFMLAITMLYLAYLLFEHLQKRKRNSMTKTIPYTPVQEQEAVPAVIMPNNDEDEKQ
ncbi:MAG: hypothetical protein ACXWDO_09285 [Bacteroidia bacterium]